LDEDPNLFFPEFYTDLEAVNTAKSVCNDCWIKDKCLDYAMQIPNLEGIWGGTTPRDRKRLKKLKTSTM
jgi:WhiB family redox-sensing transcriptional regulator